MTTGKTSITLPTDLLEYARSKGNTSQYVASLIEADRRKASLAAMFARHGYTGDQAITGEGIAAMGDRLASLERARPTRRQVA
jgi:hypothetical protein